MIDVGAHLTDSVDYPEFAEAIAGAIHDCLAAHARALFRTVCELLTELEASLPDRLVADLDVTEGEHLLDHAQDEWKAEPERQRRRR